MRTDEPSDLPSSEAESQFFVELITWWERRRIIYNLSLAGTILLVVLVLRKPAQLYGLDNAIFFSLLCLLSANLFYTLGWALHFLWQYWLGKPFSKPSVFSHNRKRWFILGMIGSVLLTAFWTRLELLWIYLD